MGDSKLCLLLLLSTSALAFAQDEDQPACLLAKRYKTLHKYEYRYEAESLNAINGASPLKNGPKASCTVEVEVPQTCSFIVRTTGCSLSEVTDVDAEGNPVFEHSSSSDAFAAEMEKYPLKFVVQGVYDVKLYPEDDETTTILNFKRGIISALVVPLLEEDKNNKMPTIHGQCKTYYQVNAREDIATDISLSRDLSQCDNFVPMGDYTSPLALISGMHYPLAQLVRSSQNCNYKFDNEKKHMTSGSCTEKHILIPFSHKGEYGVMNIGKQELTLVRVSSHNDRVFQRGDIVKGLHMEAVEDKSAVHDKDTVLKLLRELATLPESEGDRRAHLFHKLVTMVRGMKADTLSPAIPEALAVSHALTYQVLVQCGTPECSSAIMQILRTFDSSSFKVDAAIIALGLISNPSALLINDMLEMAKYKPSKSIMYALSNVVKRFYKAEGKMIPEIHSVAEFMAARLGDCSGDNDNTFMTLRVIGNMAPAVMTASPALRSAVIRCVNQPTASSAVQQAAIQVYRLISVPEEDRDVLMKVVLDSGNPMQKRIAAYLVLMKDPQQRELDQLIGALSTEQDIQVESFVISHTNNILTSTEPETQKLREMIRDALQGNEIGSLMDRTKFSNNYKIGSVKGNMLFEGTSYLPREVMLDMTLKAFGYDIEMMEIGMEGKGFEPTVDALFGENGFFPDTALKTMYFVSENMPVRVNEILQNVMPSLKRDRMKRQASKDLIKEVKHNLDKLMSELKTSQSPEAMIYLRLLGNELGYLKTNEMEEMAYSVATMFESMFKMFPTDLIAALMTKSDNTIFAHYIFMDNELCLPTVTGVPLRIALSGTFTPGIKGGLKIARDMSEVAFMPSAGIEFVTHVGSHIPEYVNSGLEMHTNIFHESGLSAKISVSRDQVKLTVPAPTSPTKLIKITNKLVAVTGSEVKTIPPVVMDKVDVSECSPFFTGMKYCSTLQYTDAFSQETSPYFPFTGDSKFAVELHPTGEVTEYTATVAYELLREGEEGRQRVDSVKFILRAEGAEPTEARAILKYNRRRNVITADIQIPDYDVEAGLRLGVVDGNTKGKGTHSISLDFLNKNIPQLSLVGRANLKAMKEGMLQGQLLVPSINADATVTASMKHDGELQMELKSEIKLMDATSEQKIAMIYGDEKIAVEFKSDVNTKTTILPKYGNEILDTQVGQTDMKVRHIFKKFVEAANNYVEKYGADIPYIQNFRLPDVPDISLPEKLFLTTEAKAAYEFNNEYITIAIPLPFGGTSTEELGFPSTLTTPSMSVTQFGLEIVSVEIPIPEFVFPESLSLSIPLFGKAEASTLVRSNLYNMKTSVAVEKDTQSYSATFDVKGTSPLDILSINIEGLGTLAITDSIKANLKSSLAHKLIEASVSIEEGVTFTDKFNLRSSSRIEAISPFGVSFKVEHTGMTGINIEEISADNNFEAMFKVGPMYAKTISTQSFAIFPLRPEAKIDSTVQFDSTIVKAQNTIAAALANGEFLVVSNTKAFEDILTHAIGLSFKDGKLSLKCDANARVLGVNIRNQAEASADASEVTIRMEAYAEDSENRAYSLLHASLDVNGLAVNSNAIVKLLENEAVHKATLNLNKDGLTTSGTTTLQSPLSLENTFNARVDFSTATLFIITKAAVSDIMVNNANTLTITLSTLDFNSKVHATAREHASYIHDITIDLKPYSASANVNNNLKLLAANFINEAQLKAELYKMGVTGSLKATYDNEEIKHTYEVSYADRTANAKFSTTGKVFGMHMNHNTELDVVGLAATITNEARFNSQSMRFDHSIRCSIVPFNINLDAIFNADGDVIMYGKHSAQLYSKFLLKAQPLAFASVHECRASITNSLDNGFSLETTFDNKVDTVLSLQEQKTSFRTTSKMNEHTFNQGVSIYNTAERTGIEVSGNIFTNILNAHSTANQEFTASAFLKYDKNADSHMIQLPLIGNLPALLESIKGFVVDIGETLKYYIDNYEIKATLDALPQDVIDFISELDIDSNVIEVKQHFKDFMQGSISKEDFEESLRDLKNTAEGIMFGVLILTSHAVYRINEIMSTSILIQEVQQQLVALDEKYDITRTLYRKIDYVLNIVEKMISPYYEAIITLIPEEFVRDPIDYIIEAVIDLDIPNKINLLHTKIRELIVTLEADKTIQAVLEKYVEFIKQLRIEKTIRTAVQIVKDTNIPALLVYVLENNIDYLKSTEVKEVIRQLNTAIETIEEVVNSLNYNDLVGFTNRVISECITSLNELIRTFEIPQKLEATRDFVNFVLSSIRGFIVNFDFKVLNVDSFFEDLKINYLPLIPEISFPEITIPEISFTAIPKVPVENLVKSLQLPKIKLPTIPDEIIFPCFGKLYGEMKFLTPIYTIKMSAQFQNSTTNKMTPQFSGFLISQATSLIEILNYKLDSTTHIAFPKISRVVLTETIKFDHLALNINHQGSVSLYGRSAQAQAKTAIKVTTTPYTANFENTAFIAMERGMSASLDTIYNHLLDLPRFDFRSEVSVNQKLIARQDGLSFGLTVDNSGEGRFNFDDGNHKSNLQLSVTPSTVQLAFSGNTDSATLKMKQQITAESGILSYFKFNVRNEADGSVLKNSLFVASGHGNLHHLKLEVKANHDAELSDDSGVISNSINIVARPAEFVYELKNKGNVIYRIFKELSIKIDLQNDYSVILRPGSQQVATVALARLDDYKMFYNFTFNNNENEAGIFVAMQSAANLGFLTIPISIPEIHLPVIDFHTPAIDDLNLYEDTELKNILTTTDQTVDVEAKIVYQKGRAVLYRDGLIQIPQVGVVTELSFKSAILNLNANAGLYADDNLVFRLGATTASVFESLKAKLQGTSSLTTRRGIKLANSLSFENPHIEGSHNSIISTSTETLETAVSVATVAKVALPIFNLETKQNLVANTRNKANSISTLTMKGDFNLPMFNSVGKAEIDHNMKLEGTFEYISMESTSRANMDGTILTDYLVLGVLDNEVNVYLNNDGLRSTSKVIADAKLNHDTTRVIGMDVNENLAIEASLNHVYAVLKYTGNNEAKLFNFQTKGKHIAQTSVDLAPTSSLTADVEIDIFQPTNLGDLIIYEKTVAEVTIPKQKILTNARFSSPLYTINLEAEAEGRVPVFKVAFKSSGTSDIVVLDYDLKASSTANFENEVLNIISNVALTGTDLTMDVNHVISQALSIQNQADDSVSRQTLNVDITSPTVTYVNLNYAATREGISTLVSIPSIGFLGGQVNSSSQMSARVYGRYPSAPEVDVDILVIKSSSKDTDNMNLHIVYNMEAHKEMLSEIKIRLHHALAAFTVYADKLLTELTKRIAAGLDLIINAIFAQTEDYYTLFVDNISGLEFHMPDDTIVTGDQIWDQIKTAFRELMYFVNNMESLDIILVKINDILKAIAEKSQEFVDSIKSDYLDAVISDLDNLFSNLGTDIKNNVDQIIAQYSEQLNNAYDSIITLFLYIFDQYTLIGNYVIRVLRHISETAKPYIRVTEGRLEIDLEFPFQQ